MKRLLFLVPCLVLAQPIPPQPGELGRQHPYISTIRVLRTNVVTTVTEVKLLRIIDPSMGSNGLVFETNYQTIRTNVVSVVATNL